MGRPLPWEYWRVFLVERGWPVDYIDGLDYAEMSELLAVIRASERGYAHNAQRDRQHAAAVARNRRR